MPRLLTTIILCLFDLPRRAREWAYLLSLGEAGRRRPPLPDWDAAVALFKAGAEAWPNLLRPDALPWTPWPLEWCAAEAIPLDEEEPGERRGYRERAGRCVVTGALVGLRSDQAAPFPSLKYGVRCARCGVYLCYDLPTELNGIRRGEASIPSCPSCRRAVEALPPASTSRPGDPHVRR